MTNKNLMNQANDSSNSIVEVSDEDLQQVVGGNDDVTFNVGNTANFSFNSTPPPNGFYVQYNLVGFEGGF